MSDPVRDYLAKKGCADHVVKGGLVGLVEAWESVVEAVSDGYNLTLDDYLNDLDTRQLLEGAFAVASATERNQLLDRVSEADDLLQTLVTPTEECLWGDEVAEEEGWTRKKNWWYYNRPINAGVDLMDELGVE